MSHGRHQRLGSHRHQEADQGGIKGGPNGDSVMLVGFSQGGILAGHLAAYRSDDDNFGAVVVCGAPIELGILYRKIGDGIDVSSGGINDALGTGR